MATWTRLKQENEDQNYWFQGKGFLTAGVKDDVPKEEITLILADLHEFVKEKQGIDYLQVYEDDS